MNEELVRSMKRSPVKYARLIGFTLLTDLHNDWIRSMAFGKEDETLLGHRGSYKTTCLSVAIALIMVLMPYESIMFIRKTDDDVIEVIRQVSRILKSEVFRYIVKDLYGIDLAIQESAFKIDTNLYVSVDGTPQLRGLGIKSSMTGKHADRVFTDDIVNIKDRISRAERDLIKLQYMEINNIVNRGGRVFNTGTPWHKDDAISIMPNVKRFDCYSTGLIGKEKLEQIRQKMTDSLFAANYELKHIADQNALFRDPQFEHDPTRIYGGRAHIDAAYGGEDYTAYTILKEADDGSLIGFGKAWQQHVDNCIPEIRGLHDMYQAGSIACERNADKGYLAKELEKQLFVTETYSENMNKFIKISTYLKRNWKRIRWIDDTDPNYLSMILDYTENAARDDPPDSVASLIRQMQEEITLNKSITGGI